MNDKDYIRKAIELADGWRLNKFGNVHAAGLDRSPIEIFTNSHYAALAAQLVRQVDQISRNGMSDILIKRLDREYDDWPTDRVMEDIRDCVDWLSAHARQGSSDE